MAKDYLIVEKWDDDYNGAAIYSLVDESGKRYIGQAKHLQQRLNTHRTELNKVYKNHDADSFEGEKLIQAAKDGVRFKVEVLKKIPWKEATVNALRHWEAYYADVYDSFCNGYNVGCMPSPNWVNDGFNEVEAIINIDKTEGDILKVLDQQDNLQGYIKELIRTDIRKGQE